MNVHSKVRKYIQRGDLHIMQKRILIAEDEQSAREALANIAATFGYDVTAVTNGVDLLTAVVDEKFDVVITDLMMPDLDGTSAAKIMKMLGNTTPVIAITGVSTDDIDSFRDSFTRVFHKPIKVSEIFEYVELLLENA